MPSAAARQRFLPEKKIFGICKMKKIPRNGGFFLDSNGHIWYNICEIESSNDAPWDHSTLFLYIWIFLLEVM